MCCNMGSLLEATPLKKSSSPSGRHHLGPCAGTSTVLSVCRSSSGTSSGVWLLCPEDMISQHSPQPLAPTISSDPSSMMFLEPRWAVLPVTTKHSTITYSEIGSLAVLESVEEDRLTGQPVSLLPSGEIRWLHTTTPADFTWALEIELGAFCLQSKHFTNWTVSPAPVKAFVCLLGFFKIHLFYWNWPLLISVFLHVFFVGLSFFFPHMELSTWYYWPGEKGIYKCLLNHVSREKGKLQ